MDEIKNQEEKKQEAGAVKNLMDPGEQLRLVRKGKMKLSAPIQDGERTVAELSWDFGKLTGLEYAEALDSGDGQNNFRMTNTQALCLWTAWTRPRPSGWRPFFSRLLSGWETGISPKCDGGGHGQPQRHSGAAGAAHRAVF